MLPPKCVIFDLDGTLVDSEGLGNRAFLDLLPDLTDTVAELTAKYRGIKLATILSDLEARLGRALPPTFEVTYRSHVAELFSTELQPIAGVTEMLPRLHLAKCVASSGPRPKIDQALKVTGLEAHFTGRTFSSYEVRSWKPDPGLFLHAAGVMGFSPAECAVVEDSQVGVEAAISAGMTVFHFQPPGVDSGPPGATAFSDMSRLDSLLAETV